MRQPPRLDAREFERLGTVPQRVRLAVGSIHRVQASLTWESSVACAVAVPDRLVLPLSELIADFKALGSGPVDEGMIADLQVLLSEARQRIARI
jgi:hypothetical protein